MFVRSYVHCRRSVDPVAYWMNQAADPHRRVEDGVDRGKVVLVIREDHSSGSSSRPNN